MESWRRGLGVLVCVASVSACDGADRCGAGGAALGAACSSDCQCATANCYLGSCLPRVVWVARYLSETSATVEALANVSDGLFVGGNFAGPLDVDPTNGVKHLSARVMALPFGTAMTTDERFLWGDVLTAAEPDPLYPNPQHVMVARPFGQSVVLGMGDGLAIRNVWRLDPATGQIQAPLAHLDALDLDVRQGTGDLVAVDMFSALRLDQAGQVVWQQTMSRPKRVLALPDGSILVAGEATSEVDLDPGPATMLYKPLAQDVLITRLDASGAWIGTAIIAGQGVHHFEDFALAGDGTVFVLGDFDGTVSFGGGHAAKGDRDVFVAALNADFTIRWVTTTGSTGADSGGYVLALPEGGVLVNGLGEIDLPGSKPPPPQVHGPFMFQLDARGEHVWSTYSDLSQRFQLGGDGGLYFFGQISGGVDVTAFRGGTIYSYGNEPLYYASGVVVKMVVR